MNSKYARIDILIDLGVSYVEGFITLNEKEIENLRDIFSKYLYGKITEEECRKILIETVGRDDYLSRINDIINIEEEPIPYNETEETEDDITSLRKKTRTWTVTEDKRLLAGVVRFGLENWNTIAAFIGNGRSRSQCSQRWCRGLNPKISKKSWTYEEDAFLLKQIKIHGEKSWTKIASIFKNRTDVQCRYRYKQLSIENMTFADPSLDICKGRISKNVCNDQFNNNNFVPASNSPVYWSSPSKMISPSKQLCQAKEVLLSSNLNGNKWGICGSSSRELEIFLSHFRM